MDNVVINITEITDSVQVNVNEAITQVFTDGVTVTGNGTISNPLVAVAGSGDMMRATYDPTNKNADAFSMENMVEGATNKILTSAERTKLNNLSGTNTGDQDLTPYLTSATAAATYQPIGSYLTSISGLNISQLTNDIGYITSSALAPYLTTSAAAATYQPILVSGTTIKTINGNSLLGSGDITISAAAALSSITAATAAHTINNAAFRQEWKWDSLGSGIGLKISTASTAATANTQVLVELRKTGVTPSSYEGYGSTLLNVINEDSNPSFILKAAHFEARNFAATFGKTGVNAGYGNVAIFGNSKLHFFHNGAESAYISRLFNTPALKIAAPPNGYLQFQTGTGTEIDFLRSDGSFYLGTYYTGTTRQVMLLNARGSGNSYDAAGTHASVIENNSGTLKLSANTGLTANSNFTPTWQLNIVGSTNNVGVGTLTPNASAKLDVSSTTQGFAPPEMTATQASAISTTSRKLIIYVTDTNGTFTSAGLWLWTGATWKLILAE